MTKLAKKRYIDKLLIAIIEADRANVNTIIDSWAKNHTYKSAIVNILGPTLPQLG